MSVIADKVQAIMHRHGIPWYDDAMIWEAEAGRTGKLLIVVPAYRYLFKRAKLRRLIQESLPADIIVEITGAG